MIRFFGILPLIVVLFAGCSNDAPQSGSDQIVETILPEFAKGFEIRKYKSGKKQVIIFNLENHRDTLASFNVNEAHTPKLACLSTTHVAFLSELYALNQLCGVAFADRLMNSDAQELVRQGHIKNISQTEEVDDEQLIVLKPDYFLVYPFAGNQYQKLLKLGIEVVPISEYLEQHPLGRAEWIKVFGVLTGKYEQACERFDQLKLSYSNITKRIAQNSASKPKVFIGSYDSGNWFVPSGNSFIAYLLSDAGVDYLYKNKSSPGNIAVPFESMYEDVYDADFIGAVLYANQNPTADELVNNDVRLKQTRPHKKRQIFYCNSALTDYFGQGIMEPDSMLIDLASIFHTIDATEPRKNKYFFLAKH